MLSNHSAARWYCVVLAVILGVRATTTLLGGADFAVPGTGWRSVWQLIMVAVLLAGAAQPRRAVAAALTVAAVYALATASELVDGTTLLAVVPVDMRDRFLHPLFAIAGLLCAALPVYRRGRRTAGPGPELARPH